VSPPETRPWWQTGIVYEIYARSFADSNGDGVGDIKGVAGRLDYLAWLGVDAIWITPIFPSPMVDGGYDVADYTGIHPMFGTLADFDELVAKAHARSIRVILDLVPNHTSDRHPWFQSARRSWTDPQRDWYIWRDPKDGGPPNNWLSEFGGWAWSFDEATGQYYYHAFAAAQPDLNWRNPSVRRAVYDVMRFWLDRGVDGFRIDVLWHLIKDRQLRDNPANPDYVDGLSSPYQRLRPVFSTDQPEVHEVVAEMRGVLDEYDDRVMIGEIYLPIDRLVDYYGRDGNGAHLPFNFHLIGTTWDAQSVRAVIDDYEGALPDHAWPNWVLGNHDQSRVATRLGEKQAMVAAVLLLTLRGTPTLYYGDELGLQDVSIPESEADDVRELNLPGRGLGRDPYRTPMPWDGSPSAGFTTGTPWLPIGVDNRRRNVSAQRKTPGSMLDLVRGLIELRRREQALQTGSYEPIESPAGVLAYRRRDRSRGLLVALNLSSQTAVLRLPGEAAPGSELFRLRPQAGTTSRDGHIVLGPDDAVIMAEAPERSRDSG
jgi:alpha-glucosidase